MLFLATQFEHHFNATTLKKGLRLFEKTGVELIERQGLEFRFLVENKEEVQIRKRADKILSYTCTCLKTDYCVHFCASLFWLEKETLGLSTRKKGTRKNNEPQKPSETKKLTTVLKELDQPSLNRFIEEYAATNELFEQTLLAWFSARSEEDLLNYYSLLLRNRLAPFRTLESMNQKQMDGAEQQVREMLLESKRKKQDHSSVFYSSLAVLLEFPVVFKARLGGNENGWLGRLEETMGSLKRQVEKGLAPTEQDAWMRAAITFLKSDQHLYEPVVSFLIFQALAFLKTKTDAAEIRKSLDKKGLRLLRATATSNPIQTLRLALAIREAELFKTNFPFKKYQYDPELILARAGLYFSSQKADKAFHYLDENYEHVKTEIPSALKEITNYVLLKTKEYQKPALELKYLEEALTYLPHISVPQLERFLELLPDKQKNKQTDHLLEKIRAQGGKAATEKIPLILLKAERLDELKKELKKQNNRFNFVNTVVQQYLPAYDRELLSVYIQHLVDALSEARYTSQQQPLFLLAKRYLDRLPHAVANQVVAQLLHKVSEFRALHGIILGLYPHALDKKLNKK